MMRQVGTISLQVVSLNLRAIVRDAGLRRSAGSVTCFPFGVSAGRGRPSMGRRDLQAVNKLEGPAAPLYAESMRSSKHVSLRPSL